MLSEQKCLREYFTACEITGKELRLSVGLFFFKKKKRLKQTALILHELCRYFTKCEGDRQGIDRIHS